MSDDRGLIRPERIELVGPQTWLGGAVLVLVAAGAGVYVFGHVQDLWRGVAKFGDADTAVEALVRRGAVWTVTVVACLCAAAIVGYLIHALVNALRYRDSSVTLTEREAVIDLPHRHVILPAEQFCRVLCGADEEHEGVTAVHTAMSLRRDLRMRLAERCARMLSLDRPLRFSVPGYLPVLQTAGVLAVVMLGFADFFARFGLDGPQAWRFLLTSGSSYQFWLIAISVPVTTALVVGVTAWRIRAALRSSGRVQVSDAGIRVTRRGDEREVSWDEVTRVDRGWLKMGALRLHTRDETVVLPRPVEHEILLQRIIEQRAGGTH